MPDLTPLSQIDPKQFNTAIMTNVVATQALLAAFDPMLRKAEAGRIDHLEMNIRTFMVLSRSSKCF